MATETHIPESVYIKQLGDNALSSEILEEKVSELVVGNKMKHVESISQVAETVNTQVEASIPTNESGTFFQALSVPMVSSNTPESHNAATTNDQDPEFVKTGESVEVITPSVEIKEKTESQGLHDGITADVSVLTKTEAKGETTENEEKNVEKEACEEKHESSVGLILSDSLSPIKEEALNTLEKNQDEISEDIEEKTPAQYATAVADIKEQEFVKEQTGDKLADAQQEETEEIIPSVEIENTKHEEKNEEEVTQSDVGQMEKSDISSIKNVCEESSSEKVDYESSKIKLEEKAAAIVNKNDDEERKQEVKVLEKDQGEDVVPSAFEGNESEVVKGKESIREDTEEIRSSVEATDVCISTQTKPEEETTKDEERNEETIKSDDGQTNKAVSHMVQEICEDTVSEMTESEQALKPSDSSSTALNETEIVSKDEDQEKERELYVSEKDQPESEVKISKLEQVNEEATESEDGQKENSGSLSIKEVCEETDSEKVEDTVSEMTESEQAFKPSDSFSTMLNETEIVSKDEDHEKEPELYVSEKDQPDSEVKILKLEQVNEEATESEDGQKENSGSLSIKEVCEETDTGKVEDTEQALKPSDGSSTALNETEIVSKDEDQEKEQELNVSEKDQMESEVKNLKLEQVNEEATEGEDGKKENSGSLSIKEVCEETDTKKVEDTEQALKPSDSSSSALNETEIVSKDEDQGKEREFYVSEKDQTESEVKTSKLEQVNEEKNEIEDGQKENSSSLSIKEVCEETDLEKVESERVELSDSSCIKLNDKVITTLSNDEVQEQDHVEDEVILHDDINTDVCVSTQAELEKETIENEDKNDEKAIEKEVCEETSPEKVESKVGLQHSDSMTAIEKGDLSTEENEKGDSDGVKSSQDTTFEDTKETTPGQYAATVSDFKEQDLNEFVKEETEDKSTDTQQASEECDKTEPKPEESDKHEDQENEQVLDILEKDRDFTSTQDVSVEGGLQEKNYHIEDIESEIVKERECIEEDTQEIKSSAERPEKSEQQRLINVIPTDVCISTQEKNDEEAIESDDGHTKKSGIPTVEEICEETVLEKDEKAKSEEGLVSKDELHVSENDQSVGNDVTSSQNASTEDVKETTIGHVTTVADLDEEAEDKAIDAQEASELYEDRGNDNREQNPEDSVKDIVHSFSEKEHKEYTEEIKPSVETNEEKDVVITTQTESQEATKNDEKSDNPSVNEVCEETDIKKTESEEAIELSNSSEMSQNEKAIEIISKNEDQEEKQQTNTVVCEDGLQGKNYDGELNEDEIDKTEETINRDNEVLRTSVETEEITEQQGLVNAITSDVSILAQKESQEDTTRNEEKNEEPIESDVGWKEKQDIPSVKEVCEETSLEKVESEEGLKLHDSLNMKINEQTVTLKDEDQVVNMSEEGQGKDNVTSFRDAISKEEEYLQQKNYPNESNEPEFVKTREDVEEEIKSSVEKEENSEQQGFSHVTTNDQAKEVTSEHEAIDAEKQADRTEDKSEMEDEVVSTEKMSSEEQNVEEIEASLTKTTEDEVTKKDGDSSHINIQDTNDGTTKEEKCFLDESRDIEISTLEHEPTKEQNSGLNEVSKENLPDLNETTSVEPRDTPPSSLEPSKQDTLNLEKAKAESEILPIEDLESVTEIQIPGVVPNSEDPKLVEECLIPVTETHLNEEKQTVGNENSSDEKTEQPTEIKKETLEEVSEQCENEENDKEEEKPVEIVKLGDQEKDQEVSMLEKDQGVDEIISAQDVAIEGGVQERNYHSEGNEQEVVTMKAGIVEDIEEKTSENEEKNDEKDICEEIVSEKVESEEGLKLSDSPNVAVNENEIESKDEYQETGQEVYVSEKGQGGEDDFLISKNASIEDIKESTHGQHATTVGNFEEEMGESAMTEEIIMEKAQDNPIDAQEMSSELGQPKEQNVEEIGAFLTTTTDETTEDEITKKGQDSSHDNVEDTDDNTIKEEKCTLENEPVEEQTGRSFDEVSKENLMDSNDTSEVEPQEHITLSGTLGTLTEDTSKSEKAKAESEVLPSEEKETVTEENSRDEKTEQTIQIKQETFEETSSEKAGSEGFKLSDSSNMEINEKEMATFNDEDQEKGQDVNISADVEEEVLQEFVETRESIDEDTKKIISSVETREHKSESPLFTEVCEATSSEKAEPEDSVDYSASFNTKVVEDETVSNDENLEKKQELTVSAVQGGGDDIISSDTVSNENIKETTIGQCATTVVDFEEGQDLNATPNEILVEEAAEDKSVDAQEASEPCGNQAEEKSEQNPEENVDEPAESCVKIDEENITKDDANAGNNKDTEAKLDEENQADITEDRSEVKDEASSTEKMPSEHGQPKEQNIEEIEACLTETVTEKSEDEITRKEEDSSQENIEDKNDSTTREEKRTLEHELTEEQHGGLDEVSKEKVTSAVEPQEDITPSISLQTSTEDTSAKAESENMPIEDLESVSQVQIPQVVPKSADVKDKEECLISEAAMKEINPEAYGERELTYESATDEHINETIQQADKSYITTEENVSRLDQIGDNDSPYEKRDVEQENQLNSTEECDEMVKDVILTEKIPVINREVTEDTLIGQEDLHEAEDISCESTVNNESIDESPKEEIIPSVEEVKTIEPEVNLSNIDSTAYPSETTPALESVCDVQASEVSADSEEREVKEECIVLATTQDTDENKSEEEQKNNTNEILSVPEEESVKQVPNKSEEEKSDLNKEEKSLIKESLELHEEVKLASESIIEEEKVNKIESQPEQSDIASDNIINDQESKLEHHEEDLILAPENKIMKNSILTDEISEKDNCSTELDNTSTSNQKELANEQVELSNLIQVANTEVTTEAKAESKIEVENLQPAEDLSCVPEASSTIIGEVKVDRIDESLKNEIIPVPEIESTDTPLNEQDSTKIRDVISCSSKEAVDEKVVLVSQLTDREILEAPDVEFDKKERDEELVSDVQPPEAILKTEVKEEHPEATNDTCETLMGVESSDKKLVSTVPPEELTSPMVEDQTNELVSEEDKTKVEHSSISNTDQNPKFTQEEFTETFSEDRTSIEEVGGKLNFAVENKEEKSGNEVEEDVIVSEVLLEDETAKESNTKEENIHNQLKSATDEIFENERSGSSPDELVEKKDSVEDTEDPKLMAESLNLKDESFTVVEASKEDSDLVTPEFESLEHMVTEEKIIKTDANEEKETQDEPQEYNLAQTTSKEKPREVSDIVETVSEGREASAVLTETLQEASPDMSLAENDPEISTATEKTEDKKEECLSVEKTGELQVSTLNSEIDEGKQNVPSDTQNKATEVQPQESSEDNKNDDSLVLPSVEKDTKQGVDSRFEEAPVIDVIKHEKGLDHTTEVKSVDVASNAACSEIEPPTKEATLELINQENKKEAKDTLIPVEDVKSLIDGEKKSPNARSEPQCSSEVVKEEDEKPEARKVNVQVVDKNLIAEREVAATKDEKVCDEEEGEDNEKTGDAPVMVEASKDMEVKVHKKSHNILSGVGSKMKHSIAKVKKAITGKSSHTKPASP